MLQQALQQLNQTKSFVDSKLLLNRDKIDEANIPVLFVELPSGQNGTLTPYPGQGIGQTWLGADGATLTLQRGLLKASRGMGDDLMGSSSSMPPWSKIKNKKQTYSRELNHITGDNKISKSVYKCDIKQISSGEIIKIWDINFKVAKFQEVCFNSKSMFKNVYQVDNQSVVRRSSQFHSETIGSIIIERLDQ